RFLRARLEHRLAHAAGLSDHLDVDLGVEEQVETGPDNGVIVDDQHLRRLLRAHLIGTSATTVVPAPSVDSIASLPSSRPTRSFIPTRPSPAPSPPPAPNPLPLSSTTAITAPSRFVSTTLTREASACFATFVSASWTIRYS